MKLKTIKRIFIAVLIIALCSCFALFGLNFNTGTVFASAETYSSTDYSINDLLENYSQTYIGGNARVASNSGQYHIINTTKDDTIVNLIPKEYFYTVGAEIGIEDEYGYFINTDIYDNQSFISTAMIFEINTLSNLESTIDRVIVTVSPIFEYQYLCVNDSNGAISINNKQVLFSTDSYCVFPYPTISGTQITYTQTQKYYLKDISFGGSLFNEQYLNPSDNGYSALNDYGSYFTAFDYEYNGKVREYGEFPIEQLAALNNDCLGIKLGDLSAATAGVPVLGNITAALGQIFNYSILANDLIEIKAGYDSFANGQIINTEKKVTTQCYYQNRKDQLAHYSDTEGNPSLAKTAAIVCNTGTDQSIWYGVGDYARAIFYVGHSEGDGVTPYYTRFIDNIALKVVDSSTDEVIKVGSGLIADRLRSPEHKTLSLEKTGTVYMLPEGQDHFTLPVQYESDYNIHVELSDNAVVTVNGESQFGKDLYFTAHANEYNDIVIDLSGNSVGLQGSIDFSVNNSLSINSISANSKYMLKTGLNGVKTLKTNNPNLIIENIYTYDGNNFISYNSYLPFRSGAMVTYPFESEQDYYIVIRNKNPNTIYNALLQISNIQTFAPEQNITVDETVQAISFVNTYNAEASFQFVLPQQNGTNVVSIFDKNGISIAIATLTESSNIKFSFALSSSEECYMYFSITDAITFKIGLYENNIRWEINGEIYTSSYQTSLQRGAQYEIRLCYCENNNRIYVTTSYNYDNRPDYYTYIDNILTITYIVPDEYVITLVPYDYPDATIRITPIGGMIVTLDKRYGTGGTDSVEVKYNQDMPYATKPSRTGYTFQGYYSDILGMGTKYYDSNMNSINKWDQESNGTIYADWTANTYKITFNKNGGEGGTSSIEVLYNYYTEEIITPTKFGYNFIGYYFPDNTSDSYKFYNEEGYPVKRWNIAANATLYAYYEPVLTYNLNYWEQGGSIAAFETIKNMPNIRIDSVTSLTAPNHLNCFFVEWRHTVGYLDQSYEVLTKESTLIVDEAMVVGWLKSLDEDAILAYNVYAYYEEPSCVDADTMITLADGSQKAVQDLTGSEQLLVWNLFTGTFDTAPILFVDSEPAKLFEIIKLYFNDGTEVSVIGEHAFWDFDLNRYTYLDKNATQYIGHWFNKQVADSSGNHNWTKVQLIGVDIFEKYTTAWSPVTYSHLCYYVNGMLSMPGGISGLLNIFEVDADTMRYDKASMQADIEEYGLFTYEEFSEIIFVPEEVFNAFNGQYLKVAIGKGMIDIPTLESLVNRYSKFFVE